MDYDNGGWRNYPTRVAYEYIIEDPDEVDKATAAARLHPDPAATLAGWLYDEFDEAAGYGCEALDNDAVADMLRWAVDQVDFTAIAAALLEGKGQQ